MGSWWQLGLGRSKRLLGQRSMSDHQDEWRIERVNIQLNVVDELCEKTFGWMAMR